MGGGLRPRLSLVYLSCLHGTQTYARDACRRLDAAPGRLQVYSRTTNNRLNSIHAVTVVRCVVSPRPSTWGTVAAILCETRNELTVFAASPALSPYHEQNQVIRDRIHRREANCVQVPTCWGPHNLTEIGNARRLHSSSVMIC